MAAMRMKRMRMIRKMTTLRFMVAVCGGGSVELGGEVVCVCVFVKILGKVSIPISKSIQVDGCVSEKKNVPEAPCGSCSCSRGCPSSIVQATLMNPCKCFPFQLQKRQITSIDLVKVIIFPFNCRNVQVRPGCMIGMRRAATFVQTRRGRALALGWLATSLAPATHEAGEGASESRV
jgi:hypothetical protein